MEFVLTPALPPVESFAEMELADDVLAEVISCLQTTANPIQKHLVPALLNGGDMLACVPVDSGTTASYLIAAMNIMETKGVSCGGHGVAATPTAVIIVPTRSLVEECVDIARSFVPFFGAEVGKYKCVQLFGGTPVAPQLNDLQEGCDLLIATPGRLIDLLEREVLSLSSTKLLVFDEVGRMMDMGFEPQMRTILNRGDLPVLDTRQTLFATCTVDAQVQNFADDFLNSSNKYHLQLAPEADNKQAQIPHEVKFVEDDQKLEALFKVLRVHPEQLLLVFVATKRTAEYLHANIQGAGEGIASKAIHGDKTQGEREEAIEMAATGELRVLVATEVASRGLTIPRVEVVVQYDLPPQAQLEGRMAQIARVAEHDDIEIVSFFSSNNTDLVDDFIQILERQPDSDEAAASLARLSDMQ